MHCLLITTSNMEYTFENLTKTTPPHPPPPPYPPPHPPPHPSLFLLIHFLPTFSKFHFIIIKNPTPPPLNFTPDTPFSFCVSPYLSLSFYELFLSSSLKELHFFFDNIKKMFTFSFTISLNHSNPIPE